MGKKSQKRGFDKLIHLIGSSATKQDRSVAVEKLIGYSKRGMRSEDAKIQQKFANEPLPEFRWVMK